MVLVRSALVGAVLVGGLVAAAGAEGAAVLVREPTVLGPSGEVHHVNTGGYEAGFDWVLTQGIDNAEVNAALWEPTLGEGAYQVEAFIPKEIGATYARYTITHAGKSSEVRLRQSNFAAEWVVLGDYLFDASQASVRSTDAAGYPGEELAWSDMRFTALATLPANVESDGEETTVNEPAVSGPEGFIVRFVGVGYRGDLLRIYARGAGATAVNAATWTAPLARGEYAVEAFIPAEHAEAEVDYTVHARDGAHVVPVLQKSYNNLWVALGTYKLDEAGAAVSADDATGVREQEIAWDAVRFRLIKLEPLEKAAAEPEAGGQGVKGPASAGRGEQLVAPPPPAVAVPKRLLEFLHLRVKAAPGHRPNPQNLYKIAALLHAGSLTARYRCAPCLVVRLPFKLRPHSNVPYTIRSKAEGGLKALIEREDELYAGTVLEVELSEPGHSPELVTYRLRTRARIERSRPCPAAPGPIGACAS
jgi:hypothetical protein